MICDLVSKAEKTNMLKNEVYLVERACIRVVIGTCCISKNYTKDCEVVK